MYSQHFGVLIEERLTQLPYSSHSLPKYIMHLEIIIKYLYLFTWICTFIQVFLLNKISEEPGYLISLPQHLYWCGENMLQHEKVLWKKKYMYILMRSQIMVKIYIYLVFLINHLNFIAKNTCIRWRTSKYLKKSWMLFENFTFHNYCQLSFDLYHTRIT